MIVRYLLKVLNFFSKSMQIEIISDVLLINFCEEFVAFEVAEPLDPAIATFAVVIVVKVLIYISRNCIVRIRPLLAN